MKPHPGVEASTRIESFSTMHVRMTVAHKLPTRRTMSPNISYAADRTGDERKGDTASAHLTDWDFASSKNMPHQRNVTAKGTWQFMSIRLLDIRSYYRPNAQDDIESLLWVLCYCLIRYTDIYTGNEASARDFMQYLFDASRLSIALKSPYWGKWDVLRDMRMGAAKELQPRDLVPALYKFLVRVSKRLFYHVELRELESQVEAHMLIHERTEYEQDDLEHFESLLKCC
ncbi:hypothetical protein PENSPDRAFT_690674 [Peniophora sp. CONT]|nr:hypothetical protein PENSPDRAFT_690674 [Peniophora sp. CONT]